MVATEQPDARRRLAHANLWLRQARRECDTVEYILGRYSRNLKHQRHLTQPPETIVYLLQQAIEKAAKSLMFASGVDERTLRRTYSHNSLIVVLDFVKNHIEKYHGELESISEILGSVMSDPSTAIVKTNDLIRNARTGDFMVGLAVLPSDQIQLLINIVHLIRDTLIAKTNEALPSKASGLYDPTHSKYVSGSDFIIDVLKDTVRDSPDGLMESIKQILDREFDDLPEWFELLKNDGEQHITINRDQVIHQHVMTPWTIIALYTLAAITFPHEATSRYPANWDTPDDVSDIDKLSQLGTQHYTKSLGIVNHLHDLHELTRVMLDGMAPLLESAVHRWQTSLDSNVNLESG